MPSPSCGILSQSHPHPTEGSAGEILDLLKTELETGDIPFKTKLIYGMMGAFRFILPESTKARGQQSGVVETDDSDVLGSSDGGAMGRWSATVLVFVAAILIPSTQPEPAGAEGPVGRGVEILWDQWGIPHVYAKTQAGLAYGFGWAQMRNHGNLLLLAIGRARGRSAEYWGDSQLSEDRWVHTLGGPARAKQWYLLQRSSMKAYLDAFAAGINAYAKAHPEAITDSVEVVLPVTAIDVLAHLHRLLYSFFLTSGASVDDAASTWKERGSNAWAIAPSRSASGHAMLLANPHLPWSGELTFFEAQLVAPGIDVYGATLVGVPVISIGFNDHLGWTHTVNTQDGEDLFDLTLQDDGYRFDGNLRSFDTDTIWLRVRLGGSTMRTVALPVRRSVHGPVVAEGNGKALAFRLVGLDLAGAIQQWWDMGRARSRDQFVAALAQMQISGFNIVYADHDGHVLYHYGGNTPRRSLGDRGLWEGVVRGDTSATLWTGLLGFADMPMVEDPPSGWVQNANDPPWWATFPPAVEPSSYPTYLAPLSMGLRAQRSARMLEGDSSITFDELVTYKHSTRMELADRVLDDLLAAAAAESSTATSRVKAAAKTLAAWDRSAESASRGAVLFRQWWTELGRRTPPGGSRFATAWSPRQPRTTPGGLADPTLAIAALDAAARVIAGRYGDVGVPWGQVYRVRRDSIDLPANGAPGELGVFRNVAFAQMSNGQYEANSGDSYVAAIEFGSTVRAEAVLGYGNATQPGSPHRTDQLSLFSAKRLRPVWRSRVEVERHLELRERPR